jgi:catechol 2,3-dioxygenase
MLPPLESPLDIIAVLALPKLKDRNTLAYYWLNTTKVVDMKENVQVEGRISDITEESTVIVPTMHHVGIVTRNIETMIEWYAKVLGMKPNFVSLSPSNKAMLPLKVALLTNDKANHRIALLSWPGLNDSTEKHRTARVHHFAFECKTIGDLLNSYIRLKDLKIVPIIVVDHGVTTTFYYHDPDKNTVELFVDNFGDWDRSSRYLREMQTDEYLAKPVDPEKIIVAHNSGMTDSEIFQRLSSGEFAPSESVDMRILTSI